MDGPRDKPGASKPDKAKRLAEALRENLRKRKAQSRSRAQGSNAGRITGIRPENDIETSEDR